MTNRRRDAEAHSRAEALRNRSLRKEAEAREDKEATRQANAAKSAALRALRLARAATAKTPSDGPAERRESPQRAADD
jgi:hypothetical protein